MLAGRRYILERIWPLWKNRKLKRKSCKYCFNAKVSTTSGQIYMWNPDLMYIPNLQKIYTSRTFHMFTHPSGQMKRMENKDCKWKWDGDCWLIHVVAGILIWLRAMQLLVVLGQVVVALVCVSAEAGAVKSVRTVLFMSVYLVCCFPSTESDVPPGRHSSSSKWLCSASPDHGENNILIFFWQNAISPIAFFFKPRIFLPFSVFTLCRLSHSLCSLWRML